MKTSDKKEIEEIYKENSEIVDYGFGKMPIWKAMDYPDIDSYIECCSKDDGEKLKILKAKLEGYQQALLSQKQEFEKILDEIENPYPIDIYPEINEEIFKEIHKELEEKFKMPLDRLSANLMRRARETLKEELKSKLKEMK
jgi:hypothetical protein